MSASRVFDMPDMLEVVLESGELRRKKVVEYVGIGAYQTKY